MSGLLKIIRKEPKTESRNILLATYGSIKGL
nr:MAG TPA: ATP synthase regulation [Caudoviricetes sp.]